MAKQCHNHYGNFPLMDRRPALMDRRPALMDRRPALKKNLSTVMPQAESDAEACGRLVGVGSGTDAPHTQKGAVWGAARAVHLQEAKIDVFLICHRTFQSVRQSDTE